jgi:hypothetical protein
MEPHAYSGNILLLLEKDCPVEVLEEHLVIAEELFLSLQ